MEEQFEKLYEVALRFDEGELFGSEAYRNAIEKQHRIYSLLEAVLGPKRIYLLEDYTAALYEEMECEARHYFQEGYRAAQK